MFQLMRYPGFDEARAKEIGDAIMAEPSNMAPSIVNSMETTTSTAFRRRPTPGCSNAPCT